MEKEKQEQENEIQKKENEIKKLKKTNGELTEEIDKKKAEIKKLKKKPESTNEEKNENGIDSQSEPPVQPAEEMKAALDNGASENGINEGQETANDDITEGNSQEQIASPEPVATVPDDKDNNDTECGNGSEQSNGDVDMK